MIKYLVFGIAAVLLAASVIFFSDKEKIGENTTNPTLSTPTTTNQEETLPTTSGNATITPMREEVTGLVIEDLVVGDGIEAVAGKKITVNYKGTLTNGTQFDSSYDRGQPFSFNLGAGQVIAGWDQGFAGMKVGGKRKLTIPPSLGYGSQDMGVIPPNSVLIFEVELLEVD